MCHAPWQGKKRLKRNAGEVASKPQLASRAVALTNAPTIMLDVGGTRPREALQKMREALPADRAGRKAWATRARIAAVMGSCPKSHDSFQSGRLVQ